MSDEIYLGPYRIGEEIGKGGMGTVYRAEHSKSGDKVAIKLIAERVADSEQFRRRFAGEIESLKRVDHPNIAKLIGYGEEKKRLFYAMELVEGPTLRQRLIERKRLPWQETLDIAIEISSALQHAHILGIIHRDLKPANLLFDQDNHIKLVDFGIIKFWDNSSTVAGSVLGTADYMAPEQAGEGSITVRTDLYALGSVMYACLVGRPPFVGKELTTLIKSLRYEKPAPLELIVPETPDELTELVHQLLEKSPADRPPTARAVNNRLKAIRIGLERKPRPTHIDSEGATHIDEGDATRVPDNGNTSGYDDPNQATNEQLTLDATLESSAPLSASTKDSLGSSASEDEPLRMAPVEEQEPSSRFQVVDEAERRRLVFNEKERGQDVDWLHWLSIAGLTAGLLSLLGFALWMMREPTADELYSAIMAAESTGQLPDVEVEMNDFLQRFPEDPRTESLRPLAQSIDIEQTIRGLQLTAIRVGGIERLEPAKQSFLEAMTLREKNPLAARRMLQQWLRVFGQPMPGEDEDVSRLAELARSEVESLDVDPTLGQDHRSENLVQRIEWMMEQGSPAERDAFLQSVIALYEDKPWAAEAIERARLALADRSDSEAAANNQ